MQSKVLRIYVEKKPDFGVEAAKLFYELRHNLGLAGLTGLRIINRYDVEGLTTAEFKSALITVFAEPAVDYYYLEGFPWEKDDKLFAIEYLPGQYDQQADLTAQGLQILTRGERPRVHTAKLFILKGTLSKQELESIKNYCINPLDSREAPLEKPASLTLDTETPADVTILQGFLSASVSALERMLNEYGLAMTLDDLAFCQAYFQNKEKRNPTIAEIRLLDTYWSDHCRHTTFNTTLKNINFAEGPFTELFNCAYEDYLTSRRFVYEKSEKDITLMDLATIAMKELRKTGRLDDQEISDENNACSIVAQVDVDGRQEEWLVMFKNETHNHPTEIEPFGGASTCLGGAIRDPLSGRVYVYQAMRVTGSGDPRQDIAAALPGKLPQRKITTEAAAGYSSYGNQIGVPAGQVAELYDEGFAAKRMELGAVIGAAPRRNVKREKPLPGDIIILLGGRTGRDGCGGATSSSKEHTEESLQTCSAEVQKGNPPIERSIQRLFRKPELSSMIKKCNDFGAGGVSVALGELADGLSIYLDRVPQKYEGLDGTELAISESQERMAIVIAKEDEDTFLEQARLENLEATVIAYVIAEPRLRMFWRGKTIVNISREFLDSNGVKQYTEVQVAAPQLENSSLTQLPEELLAHLANPEKTWLANLSRLNVCSQKGLIEMFDSSIGAATVLMPLGGKYQATPQAGMAAKLPVLHGETTTGTLMSFGYNPRLGSWSPFHGAFYAVIEACAKITAMGGDYRTSRLSLQEYFEKLGKDPLKWGKPFAAVLGAFMAQKKLGIPAIGGKDSMSGTFKDLYVPPTLVAFAVNVVDVRKIISAEFKKPQSQVILLPLERDENELPDLEQLAQNYTRVYELAEQHKILAASPVGEGGIAAALSKMCFGNRIGLALNTCEGDLTQLFLPLYGALLLEIPAHEEAAALLAGLDYTLLGHTTAEPEIRFGHTVISLLKALASWESALEEIFPTHTRASYPGQPHDSLQPNLNEVVPQDALRLNKSKNVPPAGKAKNSFAQPRVLIPVFPGTNCEYDTEKALSKAGALVETVIIRNLMPLEIENSLAEIAVRIMQSQIVVFPGGFDTAKFITAAFRSPHLQEALTELLQKRDGLLLGIGAGFQALIKLGLVPYGEIRESDKTSPALTFNTISRHVAKMVHTKITSTLSPWLYNVEPGTIYTLPVSHSEGRFIAHEAVLADLFANGQIAAQYVDLSGQPTYDPDFNPNGSLHAIEAITSPDGRVLGKMAHPERITPYVAINIPGHKDQPILAAGVKYFK